MTSNAIDKDRTDQLLAEIVDYLSRDPLCLEVCHYPTVTELTDDEKLHLVVIMERELKQSEWRERINALTELANSHGLHLDVIFSSPKVWRDLTSLVGPFTHVQHNAIVDWQRNA